MSVSVNFSMRVSRWDVVIPYENGLRVEEARPKVFPELSETVTRWLAIAREKKTLETEEFALFSNSESVARSIKLFIDTQSDPITYHQNSKAYVCRDLARRVTAIMTCFVEKDILWVQHLMTNPINIRSKANEQEEGRVKGGATLLLNAAMKLAAEEKKSVVQLVFFSQSETFYTDRGFFHHLEFLRRNVS